MILVTGATGTVGAETVRLLAPRRQPVRALVRDPSRLRHGGVEPSGVEVVTGDFDDPGSLDAAMHGVDTLVLISPAIPRQEIAAVDAATRAGVAHVIKASSKASADSPVERRRGQARIEQHLRAAGPAWTLLRSNAYLQNLLGLAPLVKQTNGFVMSAGDGLIGMVDARDVAAVAAVIATNPAGHVAATYWPTGPALISYADIAGELSAALGHRIDYRRVAPDEHRELMIRAGVPDPVATSNAQAFELTAEGDAAWITDDVRAVTGNPPRDLRAFLADHLGAFA